jgi:hypothetical protein
VQNSISAAMHQSKYVTKPHPVFLVDGKPLNLWLSQQLTKVEIDCQDRFFDVDTQNLVIAKHEPIEFNIEDLVPAQGWLIDDD